MSVDTARLRALLEADEISDDEAGALLPALLAAAEERDRLAKQYAAAMDERAEMQDEAHGFLARVEKAESRVAVLEAALRKARITPGGLKVSEYDAVLASSVSPVPSAEKPEPPIEVLPTGPDPELVADVPDGSSASIRQLVGWVGLRLMDFGEWVESLGDDLLGWSEADRG